MGGLVVPHKMIGRLSGGVRLECVLQGDTDLVEPGQEMVLMAQSGALYLDNEYLQAFVGYVLGSERIEFSRYRSDVPLIIGSLNESLDLRFYEGFGFLEVDTPSTVHHIESPMTTGAVFSQILNDHTNLVYDAINNPYGLITETDIDITNSPRVPVYNIYRGKSLWSVLLDLADSSMYHAWFDRGGVVHFQPWPAFASPAIAVSAALDKEYFRGKVEVTRHNLVQPVAQVLVEAGASNDLVFVGEYPTEAGEGDLVRSSRRFLAYDQTAVDTYAQQLYQWLTRSYTIRVEVDPGLLTIPEDALDLAQAVTVTYDGPAEDAVSGAGVHLALDTHKMFVYGYEVDFKARRGWLVLESDVA